MSARSTLETLMAGARGEIKKKSDEVAGLRLGLAIVEKANTEAREEIARLQERLDQFDAYAMPNVAAALDRIRASEQRAQAAEAALEGAHKKRDRWRLACNSKESHDRIVELETALEEARAEARILKRESH